MVSTKMLPPEVETHTIVVGGEGMSQQEIERLVKEGMVSSSETTTVTKTSVMVIYFHSLSFSFSLVSSFTLVG